MNLANKITLFRIFLIPVFLFFVFLDSQLSNYMALVVYILASLTDIVDGYIARKYDMISDFGKFADPLADKLLVLSAMVAFVELNLIKAWFVIIIISRELLITSLRIIAASKGVTLSANKWGKIKTVIQMITITVLLLRNIEKFYFIDIFVINFLLIGTLASTILSGYIYLADNKNIFK